MYDKLPNILKSVLDIIQYPNNKQEFINEFLQLSRQQAVLDLVVALPKREQEEIKQHVANAPSPEIGKELVMSHFTHEQYQDSLNKASQKAFKKYITDILQTLSPATKSTLQLYLQGIPYLK